MATTQEVIYPLVSMRFKEAIKEKGITQQSLADKSGLSKGSLSHYVNGTHCPNNLTAIKLGKILGVAPEWLMGFDGVKKENSRLDEIAMVTVLLQQSSDKQFDLIKRILEISDEKIDVINQVLDISK